MTGPPPSAPPVASGSGHRPVGRVLVAFALLSGMTAWMAHLVGASVLVPIVCEHGGQWTIDVLTVATAAVCAAGVAAAVVVHRRFDGDTSDRADGYRLLALVALASNAISLLLVLAEGVPNLVLGPCS